MQMYTVQEQISGSGEKLPPWSWRHVLLNSPLFTN